MRICAIQQINLLAPHKFTRHESPTQKSISGRRGAGMRWEIPKHHAAETPPRRQQKPPGSQRANTREPAAWHKGHPSNSRDRTQEGGQENQTSAKARQQGGGWEKKRARAAEITPQERRTSDWHDGQNINKTHPPPKGVRD